MRNMRDLVKYSVPLIGCSTSRPFHDIANPNLVGRYYMTQILLSPMVAMEIIVTMQQNYLLISHSVKLQLCPTS